MFVNGKRAVRRKLFPGKDKTFFRFSKIMVDFLKIIVYNTHVPKGICPQRRNGLTGL
jgi:hypothetical protein